MEAASPPERNPPSNVVRTDPQPRPGTTDPRRVQGICIALAAAVLLAFGRTAWHDFVNYDDEEYFSGNERVQRGLTAEGTVWAFRTGFTSNWHPLTWLSLMTDVELFGTGPAGPHITNVLLHAANTVLVFLLFSRSTRTCWRSACVAALFGLHPLHVESVAWISERKDVLSAFFGLLTLLMYERYVRARSPGTSLAGGGGSPGRFYSLALLYFALGLMSKPMLVTLPFVMLLLDYWPLKRVRHSWLGNFGIAAPDSSGRSFRRLVIEKWPFFALTAASCVATLMAQKHAVQSLAHISLGIRAVNAAVSYARYFYKTLWPVDLAIPYPHPGYGSPWIFCLAAALMLGFVALVIGLGRRHPFLVTGWFWYVGMLVPVIGLVQVGMQAMADRYTYLPLIGVFIVLVWGAYEAFNRWRLPAAAAWAVACFVLSALSLRTLDQLGHWKNSETLFRHAVTVTGDNEIAYYNLGHHYSRQNRLDEALEGYLKAVEIKPDYDDALNNLGVVLAKKGRWDEAIARIREAIRLRPNKADAHYNLGNAFAMQGRLDEALQAYARALELKPGYPEAHNNLANVLLMQGRKSEAIGHYRETLRLNPNHAGAQQQLRVLGEPR